MKKRNSFFARLFAVVALAAAVVVVIVVLASGLGEESSSKPKHGSSNQTKQQPVKPQTTAKFYVVKSGDTLTHIAHQTGIPVAQILALNPEADPQLLQAGEKLKLR